MAVHDTYHDHPITNQGEVRPVGKSRNQSSTFVAVNLRNAVGKSPHSGQILVELGLRAEDDRSIHRPPLSFFQTSSQGIAVEGSASAASWSASSRLSHRAKAKSTRSLAGSFKSGHHFRSHRHILPRVARASNLLADFLVAL